MKQHRVVIQCQEKAVVLTTSKGDRISVDVAVQEQPTATVNQLNDSVNQQDRAMEEFLDVFPNDLPGMPPDHDIEFIIELLPRTAHIAKHHIEWGLMN